jgi:hypothetical protein
MPIDRDRRKAREMSDQPDYCGPGYERRINVRSIVVAALLLANPAAGILVIVRVFGVYTVVVGLLTVARAWITESRLCLRPSVTAGIQGIARERIPPIR